MVERASRDPQQLKKQLYESNPCQHIEAALNVYLHHLSANGCQMNLKWCVTKGRLP